MNIPDGFPPGGRVLTWSALLQHLWALSHCWYIILIDTQVEIFASQILNCHKKKKGKNQYTKKRIFFINPASSFEPVRHTFSLGFAFFSQLSISLGSDFCVSVNSNWTSYFTSADCHITSADWGSTGWTWPIPVAFFFSAWWYNYLHYICAQYRVVYSYRDCWQPIN